MVGMFGIDVKSLTTNFILGYGISWAYTALAFIFLRTFLGKVKSAFLAYATSWPVWIVSTALLQAYNPMGATAAP